MRLRSSIGRLLGLVPSPVLLPLPLLALILVLSAIKSGVTNKPRRGAGLHG